MRLFSIEIDKSSFEIQRLEELLVLLKTWVDELDLLSDLGLLIFKNIIRTDKVNYVFELSYKPQ